MKPTTAQRINALAAWLTAHDWKLSGNDEVRTPESLNAKPVPDFHGDRVIDAYIDNNVGYEYFAVMTFGESATAHELPDRMLTDDDCITHDGVTYIVVCLG
jgi:hypothetical protein